MKTIEELEEAKRFPEGATCLETTGGTKYVIKEYGEILVFWENRFVKAIEEAEKKAKNKKYNSIDDIYPLTIIRDRYSGVYSGGKYTAWKEEYDNIPEDVSAGDNACCSFWDECPYKVGIGDSVTDAVNDLIKKLNQQ